jgi:hypothetical protein
MLYDDLSERIRPLDQRNLKYRFDLEVDVAWDRAAEPGLYFPWSFVADFGVPVEKIQSDSEAAALFQWAYAVSMCEAFIALEDIILDFVALEGTRIPATRSLELLCDEERKHVALFRRLGNSLRAARPDQGERFEAAYAPTRAFFVDMFAAYRGHDVHVNLHFVFWLLTTFFEEFTIFLDDKLEEHAGEIQPLWASAHTAHRREEMQHVVTDLAYLDAVKLNAAAREEWSEVFVAGLARGLSRFTAYDAALATVQSAFPALGSLAPTVPTTKTPFFRAVREAPQFRRTRQHAPPLRVGG